MLFIISIYFLIICFLTGFFLTVSADTTGYNQQATERMELLHETLISKVVPTLFVGCLILIPTIIVNGI
jgi:hypothetical protein